MIEYARSLDDLATAFSCRAAALAQQQVLKTSPALRALLAQLEAQGAIPQAVSA